MRNDIRILTLAVSLALLSWIAESASDYYTFVGTPRNFWSFVAPPSLAEGAVRVAVALAFVGLGLLAAAALRRRQRAENALRRSEEQYRELVQNANSIILRWNCDGVLTFFNEFAQTFFGYSREEVLGRNVIGTIVPETDTSGRDLTGLMADICNRPERHETNVNENMCKDGRRVWIAWTNKPVLDQAGNLMEVMSVGVDVTRQKRDAEALQASEALLRQFVEHTPAAVAMFDRDMRYLLYSNRFLSDYRLGDRDLTGLCHYEVFPDIPEHWKQAHQRGMQGFVEGRGEEPFIRADGTVIWTRWEVRPWWSAGEVGGIILLTEVITERKQAEMAREASEQKYRDLVETTDTGYAIMDSEGRTLDANGEYLRLTGRHELQEILGKSILEWTAPHDRARNEEALAGCLERGSISDHEVDHISPEGHVIPVEINARVVDADGERQILALCRDISERRQAEEERRALERQTEEHKRRFYRETILSVTDGKLSICGPEDIEPYLGGATGVIEVSNASAVSTARRAAVEFFRQAGLEDDKIDSLIVGVGEGITNAIKHATSARVYIGGDEESLWVAVADKGGGIDSLILPRAVLMRGFSTKPSLGLGYCVMLEVADRVLLNTGPQGTTVVLVKAVQEQEAFSIDRIPDTWDTVGAG